MTHALVVLFIAALASAQPSFDAASVKASKSSASGAIAIGFAAAHGELSMMLRSLLAGRFKLVSHSSTKVAPVYALVMGSKAPKIHEVAADGPPRYYPGKTGVHAEKISLARFAELLAGKVDFPVIDATALTGVYDIALEWSADETAGPSGLHRRAGATRTQTGGAPRSSGDSGGGPCGAPQRELSHGLSQSLSPGRYCCGFPWGISNAFGSFLVIYGNGPCSGMTRALGVC